MSEGDVYAEPGWHGEQETDTELVRWSGSAGSKRRILTTLNRHTGSLRSWCPVQCAEEGATFLTALRFSLLALFFNAFNHTLDVAYCLLPGGDLINVAVGCVVKASDMVGLIWPGSKQLFLLCWEGDGAGGFSMGVGLGNISDSVSSWAFSMTIVHETCCLPLFDPSLVMNLVCPCSKPAGHDPGLSYISGYYTGLP